MGDCSAEPHVRSGCGYCSHAALESGLHRRPTSRDEAVVVFEPCWQVCGWLLRPTRALPRFSEAGVRIVLKAMLFEADTF